MGHNLSELKGLDPPSLRNPAKPLEDQQTLVHLDTPQRHSRRPLAHQPGTLSARCSPAETQLLEEVFFRISADISMVTDRRVTIGKVDSERTFARPAGRDSIHISFRMGIEAVGRRYHGCLVMPLPEAISLASYLMMISDEQIRERRELKTIDETTRDAILEVCNFVGGATESALRESMGLAYRVYAEGCQGVRPDVRPALNYREGAALLVGRTRASIHDFSGFNLLLMIPELPGLRS